MKKTLLFAFFLACAGLVHAQQDVAYSGKDDYKLNIGADFQNRSSGITASLDYGLSPTFSIGLQSGYLLYTGKIAGYKAGFTDKFDLRARANAHLGPVMRLPEQFDIYPGLDLGLRNFGFHFGARYFIAQGFGVFSEIQFPIARYNTHPSNYEKLNNQFMFLIGASFDLRQ